LKNPIKQLAGQTAVYGLSSVIGRLLNYILVPLHVAIFQPDAYGVVTELYAYVAFLVVLLTYGLETAYFRYLHRSDVNSNNAFRTAFSSLLFTTSIFLFVSILYKQPIADWILYPNHPEYVLWFAIIISLDVLSALPMAKLRAQNKPYNFAIINLISIGVVIFLNLFFLLYCKPLVDSNNGNAITDLFYNPSIGVGYIFIANLVGSAVKFILLLPGILKPGGIFDKKLLKTMLIYALPLMVFGLAGIINETFDRILLRRLLSVIKGDEYARTQVGIYGANYKLAMLITIFIQAFRYAFEPFLFAHEKHKDSKKTYAYIMNVFAGVVGILFLVVMLYIDLFKHIIIPNPEYWLGLKVVPILLLANIFLGLLYNLGIWFKLSDNTRIGMYIAIFGAIITIVLNYIFIPQYEYMASAYITLIAYFSMAVVSFILGQHYYRIPYNISRIVSFIIAPVLIYFVLNSLDINNIFIKYALHSVILLVYSGLVYYLEFKKDPLRVE
jgi:O-antigen/teichoic acid export membrane protein